MNEEEMIKALEGKFFRGPSSFYQTQIYFDEELGEMSRRPATVKKEAQQEQLEREAEVSPTKWRIPIVLIIEAVSMAHGFSIKDIKQNDIIGARRAPLVAARQNIAWMIKRLRPDVPYLKIAYFMNYKDHSTVLYAAKKFERVRSRFVPEIERALEYLREKTGDQTIC